MRTHKYTGLPRQHVEALEALKEQIRVRAYQLYEQRGREDGNDLDDWLEAELEATRKKVKRAAA